MAVGGGSFTNLFSLPLACRGISARCTRQRPWRLPMAFVSHHRSIASVHCSATSYRARPCRATRARSRRPRWTAHRVPQRPSRPRPHRGTPDLAGPRRPRSGGGLRPPGRWRTPPGHTPHPRRSPAGPTAERRARHRSTAARKRGRPPTRRGPVCRRDLRAAAQRGQPAAHWCHQRGVEEQVHPREPPHRRPRPDRQTGRRPRGRVPTRRWSHRDHRPRRRPRPAAVDRRGPGHRPRLPP